MRKKALRIISGLGGVVALIAIMPQKALAQDASEAQVWLDNIWVLVAGALVFFMQAGFAFVEAGLTRAKNVVNILAKNLSDALIGFLAFYAFGYGLAFGGSNKILGTDLFFLSGEGDLSGASGVGNLTTATFFFFQAVFCATAVTIASGAWAERTKFISYLIFSAFATGLIYPIVVHWTWGGGLIAQIEIGDAVYSDFAGSTIVHMTGGIFALVGALILGPRIGKYDENGKPRVIPGHSISLVLLGVFILWLGWFGFNPGSELAADGWVGVVALNTMLASAAGGVACTATIWLKAGKPDLGMIGNGVLAGLVSITAPCGTVSAGIAIIIGAIGGVLVVFSVLFFEKIKIDDPVGAVSVHGACGIWGTLSIGLFAKYDDAFLGREDAGLFYGGGIDQLIMQLVLVLIVAAWVTVATTIILLGIKATIGFRVSAEEEIAGLDIREHGMEGYPADVHYA